MSILGILNYFRLALTFGFNVVTKLDFTDLSDPERHDDAIKTLKEVLAEQNIVPPKWLDRYVDAFLGTIIDVVVFLLKKQGFLESGDEKYADS